MGVVWGVVRGFWGVSGDAQGMFLCQKQLRLSWEVDECKPLPHAHPGHEDRRRHHAAAVAAAHTLDVDVGRGAGLAAAAASTHLRAGSGAEGAAARASGHITRRRIKLA